MDDSSQKFYWLKLKRDFFKRHDIQIIEDMPNGKEYILFYLKLLCESVDHEGNLRFSEQIPYNEQMLSTITRTNVDVVRAAIKCFTELNMMEVLDDGTIFMREVHKMLGSETAWAEKKRAYRESLKRGQDEDIVLTLSDKSKSKRIEKEIEIKRESIERESEPLERAEAVPLKEIASLFNSICQGFSPIRSIQGKRETAVRARWNEFGSIDAFANLFHKAQESAFLRGKNKRGWKADFDWIVNGANASKILEGRYDDDEQEKTEGTFDTDEFLRDALRQTYGV